jgi:hypothetical protein
VSSRTTAPASLPAADIQSAAEGNGANQAQLAGQHHRRANVNASQAIVERSALGRLRADEQYFERRRHNVSSFGSTWLKPPGIGKSLFQLREERREAEEHAEALRRERLAQELAEAEAANAEAAVGDVTMPSDGGVAEGGDEAMGDLDGEARDLDDEIPDADAEGFGLDGAESNDDEDDDGVENAGDIGAGQRRPPAPVARLSTNRELQDRVASIRATEDRVRDMIAHRQSDGPSDIYGIEGEVDEDDEAQMLEEEDLVSARRPGQPNMAGNLEMEVNLDDDIPEAGGVYEHTDTEADLSSSEMADESSHLVANSSRDPRHPGVRAHVSGSRDDLDISSLLSRDESSVVGSSPHPR